jgi:hypothetical protein
MIINEVTGLVKTAVFTFGRMNPPTIGHRRLVNIMCGIKGDPYIFLSHTQDSKTNPLDFDTKLKYAKKFFPDVTVGHKEVKTVVDALKLLEKKKYLAIVFVAGSDRIAKFGDLIKKYNGKEYKFDSIEFVSAGNRSEQKEGIEGMSATKMRRAVVEDDFEKFSQGVPDAAHSKPLFKDLQKVLAK